MDLKFNTYMGSQIMASVSKFENYFIPQNSPLLDITAIPMRLCKFSNRLYRNPWFAEKLWILSYMHDTFFG